HQPVIARSIRHPEVVCRNHRLVPRADGGGGIRCGTVEFGVALAKQREGVLVGTQPDMQAVLLDPSVLPAARGALSAQSPSALINSDRLDAIPPTGFTEPPGGAQ